MFWASLPGLVCESGFQAFWKALQFETAGLESRFGLILGGSGLKCLRICPVR